MPRRVGKLLKDLSEAIQLERRVLAKELRSKYEIANKLGVSPFSVVVDSGWEADSYVVSVDVLRPVYKGAIVGYNSPLKFILDEAFTDKVVKQLMRR